MIIVKSETQGGISNNFEVHKGKPNLEKLMLAFLARPLSSEYLLGRDEGGLAGFHKVNSRGKGS